MSVHQLYIICIDGFGFSTDMICAGGTPIRTLLVKHLPSYVRRLQLKHKSPLSHDIRFLLNLKTNKRIQQPPSYQRNTNLFTFRWGE